MRRRSLVIAGAVGLTAAETAVLAKRRGRVLAAETIVRCRRGHLFTTLWIPGASLKSLRLGWWRGQRCPVGHHWTFVTPVDVATLTPEARAEAARTHDVRLP
jgi:hypothetical protein